MFHQLSFIDPENEVYEENKISLLLGPDMCQLTCVVKQEWNELVSAHFIQEFIEENVKLPSKENRRNLNEENLLKYFSTQSPNETHVDIVSEARRSSKISRVDLLEEC